MASTVEGLQPTPPPKRSRPLPARPEEKSPPRRAQQTTQKGAELIGPYQLGNEIGRGYFGVVYKALNVETGDFVAIKSVDLSKCDEKRVAIVEREINLLRKLHHEYIVSYVNFIKEAGKLHMVLEYIENGSLHDIIKKFGVFPESLVQIYVRQVLEGLHYLHSQGIIHRDIKGSNILITKGGTCKLADFGTSTFLEESGSKHISIVGTPYWMAPEILGQEGVTSASDIWSLGCTIIELITGTPPWGTLDPMAALFRISQGSTPPIPENISDECKEFLAQCFIPAPSKRATAKMLLRHPFMQKAFPTNGMTKFKSVSDLASALQDNKLELKGQVSPNNKHVMIDFKGPKQPSWTPTVLLDEDEHDSKVEKLFQQLEVYKKDVAGEQIEDIKLNTFKSLREALKESRATEEKWVQLATELYESIRYYQNARSEAFETSRKYKNIADEAVVDRQRVLIKLQNVQSAWKPSERMDEVNKQRHFLSLVVKTYQQIELMQPVENIASAIFGVLSVDNLKAQKPEKMGHLKKQSLKATAGGGNRKSNWQDRLFLLKHNYLFYFKGEKDPYPAGILHLDRFEIQMEKPDHTKAAPRVIASSGGMNSATSPMVNRKTTAEDTSQPNIPNPAEKMEIIEEKIAEWYGGSPRPDVSKSQKVKRPPHVSSKEKDQFIVLRREGLTFYLAADTDEERVSWHDALISCSKWCEDHHYILNQ